MRHLPDGDDSRAWWARGWPAIFGLLGPLLVDETLYGELPQVVQDLGGKSITVGMRHRSKLDPKRAWESES